jgi:galactose mutarotase-like enzyme
MPIKISPGVRMLNVGPSLKSGPMTMYALGTNLPKGQPGILGVVVTPELNIAHEIARLPDGSTRDILNSEGTLTPLARAVREDPFNIFQANRKAGGAGHSGILWPFANRVNGAIVSSAGNEMVKVQWQGREVLIPANWPPPHSREPSRLIHGFGYRMSNTNIKGEWDGGLNGYLEGKAVVPADQWFSSLEVTHRISLRNGVLQREVSVRNTGKAPAPFACGEHPDIVVPKGQRREEVLLGIPASLLIKIQEDGSMLPDFSGNPLVPVEQSHLAHLFKARNEEGLFPLGDTFIDTCFTGLTTGEDADGWATVRVLFPALKWGVSIETRPIAHPGMVNALQIYAPNTGTALVAVEFQGNVPDPFNSLWDNFDLLKQGSRFITGSGLHIFPPNKRIIRTWAVTHRIVTRP